MFDKVKMGKGVHLQCQMLFVDQKTGTNVAERETLGYMYKETDGTLK